jgi:hypothetical protein
MRILAMDGGPSSMIYIRLLRHIEARMPGEASAIARTQLFAGASDGFLLGSFLASRLTDRRAENLRVLDACIEFSNEVVRSFHATAADLLRFGVGIGPLTPGDRFAAALETGLGERRFRDVKRDMLALTYNRTTWRSQVFCSWTDPDRTLLDAGLASSACPLVLPIYRSPVGGNEYLDGAVVANNPAMSALVACADRLHRAAGGDSEREPTWARLDEVVLLSLGGRQRAAERHAVETGIFSRVPARIRTALGAGGAAVLDALGGDELAWGWMKWVFERPLYLVDVLIQGSIDEVHFQCRKLLDERRYHRLQPALEQFDTITDLIVAPPEKSIAEFDRTADELARGRGFEATLAWMDQRWMRD